MVGVFLPLESGSETRCMYVFNAKVIVPSQVVHVISFTSATFWEATLPSPSIPWPFPDSSRPPTQWCPPNDPYIKLNVDASWNRADEAMTVLRGCELAAELGFRWVMVESDSSEGCCWSWIPRSANQTVDLLASRKNMKMCSKTWVRRPSSSLIHILNKDGLSCPP
ncbi:hypothetical protein ACFX2J_042553 [Malus domestica]